MLDFNQLLATDCYKILHSIMYCPGCDKVYSYLTTRNNERLWDRVQFFGLQYYIKRYLSHPLTPEMGEEFLETARHILGNIHPDIVTRIRNLCKLGYWPLKIKAVAEGTIVPVRNVLMTITNTLPEYFWCVGFVESLLLKVWYSTTVATCCFKYKNLLNGYVKETVDDDRLFVRDWLIADFGYRGSCAEEDAAISGGAHLINFKGSDTVVAFPFLIKYYNADTNKPIMKSVPASEHSCVCSFGKEDELASFEHNLNLYPSGIVSLVSDTFDFFRVITEFTYKLKDKILARDGKVVFRPDSGIPELIINGNPDATYGSPEYFGAIRLLDQQFGSSVNKKGYRVLNPKVGLIYGDGQYFERYQRILEQMKKMGYSAENLVIGVGSLLRNHTRDTLGFAIKATNVTVNGVPRDIEKDPKTDHKKRSHKGMMCLLKDAKDNFYTKDQISAAEEETGFLETVFLNGQVTKEYSLDEIRERVESYLV